MDISDFKKLMKDQAEYDKNKRQAQITASDLNEALLQASIELSLPIKEISYEILQNGRKGLFGVGAQECVIIAYESDRTKSVSDDRVDDVQFSIDEEIKTVDDLNGVASIRCLGEKVFLRVRAPEGKGIPAEITGILKILKRRGVTNFDKKIIAAALEEMSDTDVIIGSFVHNPAFDAILEIQISEDDMAAFIVISEPGPGGEDLTESALEQFIKDKNILHGIDEKIINTAINYPDYVNQILFAQGSKAVHGKDAYIEYLFETDQTKLMPKEVDGRVNFRNMNLIQNVIEGQVLAKKVSATKGEDGFTVNGQTISANDGNDIDFSFGENVSLTKDENSLFADLNGQVILSETGRVSVAPVFIVQGDVDLKNGGNIDFIGAVVVKGSVEDGYSVTASKNIEINGTVGKSTIMSGGDIILSQGVAGKEEGNIVCSGNLVAKFIENAKVMAKGNIIVRDGIVNAHVDSNSSIICREGKRSAIVGGHIRASHKVVAKTIGSIGGVETIIEVGFEPEKRQRFEELKVEMTEMTKEISNIDLNLKTIEKNPTMKAHLSPEKLNNFMNFKTKKAELGQDLKELSDEYQEIKQYLEELKTEGFISVEGKIFPGVKINISGAEFKVKTELRWTTFYKEGPVIRFKEFSEVEDVK